MIVEQELLIVDTILVCWYQQYPLPQAFGGDFALPGRSPVGMLMASAEKSDSHDMYNMYCIHIITYIYIYIYTCVYIYILYIYIYVYVHICMCISII